MRGLVKSFNSSKIKILEYQYLNLLGRIMKV